MTKISFLKMDIKQLQINFIVTTPHSRIAYLDSVLSSEQLSSSKIILEMGKLISFNVIKNPRYFL